MAMDVAQLGLRGRKAWGILRNEGASTLVRRGARFAHDRLPAPAQVFPLGSDEVADSTRLERWVEPARRPAGSSLTIGWVITPPGPGSGGHTTLFRLVHALERAGHTCVLLVHDRKGGDLGPTEHLIRTWWPQVRALVRRTEEGARGLDAVFATSWPTAHVLARHAEWSGRRFYLVQDFEPYFYGRGAEYALAEDTYRFGFRHVTVGPMLSALLTETTGAQATPIDFGCDGETYRLVNPERRRQVAFYGKPDAPRRGFALGVMAMELFNRSHPDIPIHTFGVRAPLPFPAVRHAHVPPTELSRLYNQCAAGLVLSFTNASLVPHELLACGAVPVVNDDDLVRAVLGQCGIRFARPTPGALADQLGAVLDGAGPEPAVLAAGVSSLSWEESAAQLVGLVEAACIVGLD